MNEIDSFGEKFLSVGYSQAKGDAFRVSDSLVFNQTESLYSNTLTTMKWNNVKRCGVEWKLIASSVSLA